MPHPDENASEIIAGVRHRVGCLFLPTTSATRDLVAFAIRYFRANFTPIHDVHNNVEDWLGGTDYSASVKEKLRAGFTNNPAEVWQGLLRAFGCFAKDEFYDQMKALRQICAPDDWYKVFFGPITKEIEKIVYEHPACVKHLPTVARPSYVEDRLSSGGCVIEGDDGLFYHPTVGYVVSDHSCFESAYTPYLKKAFYVAFYTHMLQGSLDGVEFIKMKETTDTGNCTLVFKRQGVRIKVRARTKSGSMDTSLMNFLLNLVVIEYTLTKLSEGHVCDEAWFKNLGFRMKLKRVARPGDASFCGLVYSDSLQTVRDPLSVLAKLGWLKKQYVGCSDSTRRNLTRLKCLSFLFECPHCPVLSPLCRRVVEVTNNVMDRQLFRYMTPWEKEWFRLNRFDYPDFAPTDDTRSFFAEYYCIPREQQLKLEAAISTWNLGFLPTGFERLPFPDLWLEMWDSNVVPTRTPNV
jgi:hypothetical protein